MSINKISFDHFTAFKKLDVHCSEGINIFIGQNGMGKTHILKAAYAACDISKTGLAFPKKLVNVFMPSGNQLNRLVYRQTGRQKASLEISRADCALQLSFTSLSRTPESTSVAVKGMEKWIANPIKSVFLPVKEMLANAPGFRSLYNARELHFEEIYADLVDRAYLPPMRGAADVPRKRLMKVLEQVIEGRVRTRGEEFFLCNKQGNLEFSLLAEGMRKLALLLILIQNGALLDGSILFWDEPEANLNPKIMRIVVEILLELQRMGVQIFIATHDYVTLKEFDLQTKKKDRVLFHGLYRDLETQEIQIESSDSYLQLNSNAITDTFGDLYDRDIQRALGQGETR